MLYGHITHRLRGINSSMEHITISFLIMFIFSAFLSNFMLKYVLHLEPVSESLIQSLTDACTSFSV